MESDDNPRRIPYTARIFVVFNTAKQTRTTQRFALSKGVFCYSSLARWLLYVSARQSAKAEC
jgi:hypothetical protein